MTLPPVLITDTNIWIDLDNGKILSDVFRLPYRFYTTDFALQEFHRPNWDTLQSLGLQTYVLDAEYVLELYRLRQIHRQLSVVDIAAMLLAKMLEADLVTGDRHLYQLASSHGLVVHGVLWLLDEMLPKQLIAPGTATAALRTMLERGARLPSDECQRRFENWID